MENPAEDWGNPHRNEPRMLKVSRIIAKVLRQRCADRTDEGGYVEMKQLLSHKFARWMAPEMNYEELMGLVETSERYRVKIAQGVVKVKTMAVEDERTGKKGRREKKKKAVAEGVPKKKDRRDGRWSPRIE